MRNRIVKWEVSKIGRFRKYDGFNWCECEPEEIIQFIEKKKECLHKWCSVYYGSEWEVECKKCNKNVYDVYEKSEANKVVRNIN